ncbi:MAG: hypothetical protein OXC07_13430 [Kistimonas sp.]|nr:hypothetical protein [Kistimonas sp.]
MYLFFAQLREKEARTDPIMDELIKACHKAGFGQDSAGAAGAAGATGEQTGEQTGATDSIPESTMNRDCQSLEVQRRDSQDSSQLQNSLEAAQAREKELLERINQLEDEKFEVEYALAKLKVSERRQKQENEALRQKLSARITELEEENIDFARRFVKLNRAGRSQQKENEALKNQLQAAQYGSKAQATSHSLPDQSSGVSLAEYGENSEVNDFISSLSTVDIRNALHIKKHIAHDTVCCYEEWKKLLLGLELITPYNMAFIESNARNNRQDALIKMLTEVGLHHTRSFQSLFESPHMAQELRSELYASIEGHISCMKETLGDSDK